MARGLWGNIGIPNPEIYAQAGQAVGSAIERGIGGFIGRLDIQKERERQAKEDEERRRHTGFMERLQRDQFDLEKGRSDREQARFEADQNDRLKKEQADKIIGEFYQQYAAGQGSHERPVPQGGDYFANLPQPKAPASERFSNLMRDALDKAGQNPEVARQLFPEYFSQVEREEEQKKTMQQQIELARKRGLEMTAQVSKEALARVMERIGRGVPYEKAIGPDASSLSADDMAKALAFSDSRQKSMLNTEFGREERELDLKIKKQQLEKYRAEAVKLRKEAEASDVAFGITADEKRFIDTMQTRIRDVFARYSDVNEDIKKISGSIASILDNESNSDVKAIATRDQLTSAEAVMQKMIRDGTAEEKAWAQRDYALIQSYRSRIDAIIDKAGGKLPKETNLTGDYRITLTDGGKKIPAFQDRFTGRIYREDKNGYRVYLVEGK